MLTVAMAVVIAVVLAAVVVVVVVVVGVDVVGVGVGGCSANSISNAFRDACPPLALSGGRVLEAAAGKESARALHTKGAERATEATEGQGRKTIVGI